MEKSNLSNVVFKDTFRSRKFSPISRKEKDRKSSKERGVSISLEEEREREEQRDSREVSACGRFQVDRCRHYASRLL